MKTKKAKSQKEKRFFSAKDYEMIEEQLGIMYGEDCNEAKIE